MQSKEEFRYSIWHASPAAEQSPQGTDVALHQLSANGRTERYQACLHVLVYLEDPTHILSCQLLFSSLVSPSLVTLVVHRYTLSP